MRQYEETDMQTCHPSGIGLSQRPRGREIAIPVRCPGFEKGCEGAAQLEDAVC
jgi:hypothetical protein